MLKIVGDGRKAALDLRLVLPTVADLPTSKINTAAWNIAQIYHRTNLRKSAQLVFCDLGTPKPHKDSAVIKESEEGEETNAIEIEDDEPEFENVYADIKSKLVKHGVKQLRSHSSMMPKSCRPEPAFRRSLSHGALAQRKRWARDECPDAGATDRDAPAPGDLE
jgi:hypothetical protein